MKIGEKEFVVYRETDLFSCPVWIGYEVDENGDQIGESVDNYYKRDLVAQLKSIARN